MRARKLVFVLSSVMLAGALSGGGPSATAESYLIRRGDTLSQLAKRLGVSVEQLARANNISDPDYIVAGRMLVVPSDGGSATEYVVRKGDTLSSISARMGVPVRDLLTANGLQNPDGLPAGRLLSIPPVGASTAGPAAARRRTYTVREGDTLFRIALDLGVPLGQLAGANEMKNANLIVPGQVLTVPIGWLCPVPQATFVNDYGYARPNGFTHRGIDMFAPRGTPILAPIRGRAERYPNQAGGNAVEFYGNDGFHYYFAHLEDYGTGGEVEAGTVVGYVGTSGDAAATSPHLHFEIHPAGGATINPFPTLVAACR
jgi:murein DD-endopeptidase MepM/ murein hydrolase activator NlpD